MVVDFLDICFWCGVDIIQVLWCSGGFAGWGFVVRCEGGGLGFCCALRGWWVLGL